MLSVEVDGDWTATGWEPSYASFPRALSAATMCPIVTELELQPPPLPTLYFLSIVVVSHKTEE